ncbi:MAG: hypothetical protein HUJ60_04855, partial [Bacilli bacterium]|nr:hypothetical protein [Bacilli bacterium]
MNGTKILGDETTSLVFDRMGKAAICRAIDESLSAEKSDKRDGLIRRACSAWKSNALRDGEMLAILRVLSPERYEAIKNLYDIDYAKMGSRPGNLDWDRVVEHLKKNGPSLEGIYAIAVYGYLEGVFPRV